MEIILDDCWWKKICFTEVHFSAGIFNWDTSELIVMNNSILNEDFMEYDDWREQSEFIDSTFTDENLEVQLSKKFKNEDYFFRKQAFNETMIYIHNQQFSDNISSLLNALKVICNDCEPSLRCELAENLLTITKLCNLPNLMKDYNCVTDFSLPCVIAFFHDTNKQVRIAAHGALINFIENKLVDKVLFYKDVWGQLEELMVSYNPDELRTECFTLLVQISHMLDNCLEQSLLDFSQEFIASNDNLRKTCASYLCTIVENCSNEFVTEWLEIFYKLSEDTSWYVKKFCIESAVALSKKLSHEERWNNITRVYVTFLTDNKKWVTSSAYQNLGAFIATFADSSKSFCELNAEGQIINLLPPDQILDKKTPMKDNSASMTETPLSDESDMINYNSFSFWKPPFDSCGQKSSVSSICLSLKDLDINTLQQSIQTEFGIPDLSDYDQKIIPIRLLQCYLNVVHESSDIDLVRPCAYSMPAIMFTLGPLCWPYLRSAYKKLVQSLSWKVRVSLASSIHHIFQIFKHNASAVSDIIWAYKEFIKDVDEVKTGLMSNVSQFFLALPVDRYCEIFEENNDLFHLDNAKNWRYRVSCMEQLEAVVANIEIKTQLQISQFLYIFKKYWISVVFNFVSNEVYAVRISALEMLLKSMLKFGKWRTDEFNDRNGSNVEEIDDIISMIRMKISEFSESENWFLRQLFLQSCIKITQLNILSQEVVNEHFLPKYLDMCIHDPVPNNRMIGGQGLSGFCSQEYLSKLSESSRSKMETVYNFLSVDSDRDVRYSVMELKDLFGSLSL